MTDRIAFDLDTARARVAQAGSRRFWTSVDELIDEDYFRDLLAGEFPSAAELIADPQRRHMLKLMGASLLLAGLPGCSPSSSGEALPYVNQPEQMLPGVPRYFATALTFEGYAQPVIATTYDARPTKLDGNPEHPATRGKSDSFMQSAVFGLYDPERARQPTHNGAPSTWGAFQKELADLRASWRDTRGRGLRIVIGRTTSPTLERQLKALLANLPDARLHIVDPIGAMRRDAAMTMAFGRVVEPHVNFADCEVVVSLDDDFLGPGPQQVRNALGFAQRRGETAPGQGRSRLHVAESIPSATGTMASARIPVAPARTRALMQALAGTAADLSERERAWVERATHELREHAGRGVLLAGAHLDADVQALAAQLNDDLGNGGRTLRYSEPIHSQFSGASDIAALAKDIAAGQVETLVFLDGNPGYAASSALRLAELIPQVKHRIATSLYRDETAALCQWHLPLSHALESWGDARAVDGTLSIIQPVIKPLYATRNMHQFIEMLAGTVEPAADGAVLATWRERFGNDAARWKRALHDGFVADSAAEFVAVTAQPTAAARHRPPVDEIEIVFRPDPTIWDGCFANIAWLQELPKPLTKITWDNVVAVGPALAARHQLSNGDHVEVASGGRTIAGPAWIVPGQAADTVGLYLGYGRRHGGEVCRGLGYDAYRLLPADGAMLASGSIRRLGGADRIATTQAHHRMEGFDFVREVTVKEPHTAPPKDNTTLYPDWADNGTAWGMVIDLDLCIGCNACVSACNVENNVPVVGKDQVARGREMAWLRIDRYYTGDIDAPRTFFQPVPCMHCEKAPCEMGCPVNATVHSPDGLNQQIYNRCIGTRTCSSYCPYKVRRFNWYDLRKFDEASRAAKNPDVTVRSRGVMEKCTYCTQRIQAARVAADKEKRGIRDGEVTTACQQACPTQAIVFGNLKDKDSAVAKRRGSGRHYTLLEELGTRPRTTYLARWNDGEDGEGA